MRSRTSDAAISAGPKVVPAGARAAKEVFELCDAPPVARHHDEPHVVRVPGSSSRTRVEVPDVVDEDLPGR